MTHARPLFILVSVAALAAAGCHGDLGGGAAPGTSPGDILDPGADPIDAIDDLDPGEDPPVEELEPEPEPAPFDPAPPHIYARKVKVHLTGLGASDEEIEALRADPGAMRGLVADWIETPEFRARLHDYLIDALAQDGADISLNLSRQIHGNNDEASVRAAPQAFLDNVRESMARTALQIVEEGRPFTEITTTRRWQMTTGLMSWLVAVDDAPYDRKNQEEHTHTFYHEPLEEGGFDENTPLARQIAERTWYTPQPRQSGDDEPCEDPKTEWRKGSIFAALAGGKGRDCRLATKGSVFDAERDYADWREVEIVEQTPENRVEFWDVLKLRGATTIALRVPRAGFFSTPAFFSSWVTNEDNDFRVTTNQALISALGRSFEDSDVTIRASEEGLDKEHADPTTACYGCHRNLDPMRNFFARQFDPKNFAAREEVKGELPTSFGFFGHTGAGNDLRDLGAIIADHPDFAEGWTQKLCLWVNGQQCAPDDPEFARVVGAFRDSDHDFKTLLVELFASPLVTGAARTETFDATEYRASIARQRRFCDALVARLGQRELCDSRPFTPDGEESERKARPIVAAVAGDAWSRGATRPAQPLDSSLFYVASTDRLCELFAERLVNREESPYQSEQMEASVTALLDDLLMLPEADPRRAAARAMIEDHLAAIEAADDKIRGRDRLRSAFQLACSSPYMTSADL